MCGGGGCCVWYGRRGAVSPAAGWLLWSCCPPGRWLLSLLWGWLSGVLALAVGVAARLRWRWLLLQGVVVVLGLPVLVVVAGFVALGWLLWGGWLLHGCGRLMCWVLFVWLRRLLLGGCVGLGGLLCGSWWATQVAVEEVGPVHVVVRLGCRRGLALLCVLPPACMVQAVGLQPSFDLVLFGFVTCSGCSSAFVLAGRSSVVRGPAAWPPPMCSLSWRALLLLWLEYPPLAAVATRG